MASLYDEDWSDAATDLDAQFGEEFLVTPALDLASNDGDVNGPDAVDTTRQPVLAVMRLYEEGKSYFPEARGTAANSAQRRAGGEIQLTVMARNLPPDWSPRAGDVAQRVSTGKRYRVVRVDQDDVGRIWMPVTTGGAA